MKVNFGARFNSDRQSDWGYIPLNGKWGEAKWALCLHRTVMMRQAAWTVKGLAHYVGREERDGFYTMGKFAIKSKFIYAPETRSFLGDLKQIVKLASEGAERENLSKLDAFLASRK